MTLPTSKQRMPIFPEQRAHMASHVKGSPPDLSKPGPTLLPSGEDNSWHQSKMRAEHAMVYARLEENNKKQAVYLDSPNFNRLHAVSQKRRKASKRSHSLHGGVFTSKMGQEWGRRRLKERIAEYNVRASAAFGVEAQQAPPTAPPGKSAEEMEIEVAFSALFDAIQAVEFTNMIPAANKILSLLYSKGSKIGVNEAISYLRFATDIKTDLLAALEQPPEILGEVDNTAAWAVGKKRVIKTVLPVIDRLSRLLNLVVKTGNYSETERKLAITSSQGRDVAEAKSQYDNSPAFASPSRYYTAEYKLSRIGEETDERNPDLPPPGAQRDLPATGQPRTTEMANLAEQQLQDEDEAGRESVAPSEESSDSESSSGSDSDSSYSGETGDVAPKKQPERVRSPPKRFGEGRRRRKHRGGCGDCDLPKKKA